MVHVKMVNKNYFGKLHKNGVSFLEDRNVSVLDHQHGCQKLYSNLYICIFAYPQKIYTPEKFIVPLFSPEK